MPSLSSGTASPASGTTATTFTFSVVYADTKGCAPNWVRVTVAGVGVFPMSGAGTSYDTGVTFTRAMQLPVGTHTYSFAASSGDGSGRKTTALAAVSPPSVTVTVPSTPPPEPTPKPTPKPVPTPVPTSAPTPVGSLTPSQTGSPVATPVAGSSGHGATPAPAPGGIGVPPGSAAPSQDQGQAPGASSSPGTGAASLGTSDGMGSFAMLIGGWATATLGGLALFLFLAPGRRRRPEPALAEAGRGEESGAETLPPPTPPAPPAFAHQVPPDEVNIPRWLRPSVQAARHEGQRGSRSDSRRLGDS